MNIAIQKTIGNFFSCLDARELEPSQQMIALGNTVQRSFIVSLVAFIATVLIYLLFFPDYLSVYLALILPAVLPFCISFPYIWSHQILLAKLRHQQSKLEKLNVELDGALRENQAAYQKKYEFLAGLSHELRTPLNSILGYAQLMLMVEEKTLTKWSREAIDAIMSSGEELHRLNAQLADLARIEAGLDELNLCDQPLSPLLRECIKQFEPMAIQKGLRIVGEDLPDITARVDCDRFKQICRNLLSNAVQYGAKDTEVEINILPMAGDRVRLSITDHGPGIAPEKAEMIFEPFKRLTFENTDLTPTGISLAISRQLAVRMAGDLGYEDADGRGSTFWFEVPVGIKKITRH